MLLLLISIFLNDHAGKRGAVNLANYLLTFTEHVKVVTGFHEICKEKSEDITDFFAKYGKNKANLIRYIEETPTHGYTHLEKVKSKLPKRQSPLLSFC